MLLLSITIEDKSTNPVQVTLRGDGGPAGGGDYNNLMPCCQSVCSGYFQCSRWRCCSQRGKGWWKQVVVLLLSTDILQKDESEANNMKRRTRKQSIIVVIYTGDAGNMSTPLFFLNGQFCPITFYRGWAFQAKTLLDNHQDLFNSHFIIATYVLLEPGDDNAILPQPVIT